VDLSPVWPRSNEEKRRKRRRLLQLLGMGVVDYAARYFSV
jgi:hypothetical protein